MKSEIDNELGDTYSSGNRAKSLLTNCQMQTKTIEHPASSLQRAAHELPTNDNGPFINGDLIDLCDQANDREQLSESGRDLVEAINSQLLADICGESPPVRDCHVLYPTKVSFDNTISGKKSNHNDTLKYSVDISNSAAAARSSEAIGKCSESNGTTSEQHQTVIREFKRIGTYCTLRPEQRRKHLLKVLPTLRNSMLLQTLLGSNTATKNISVTTNKDIDSLLIDLDDFILDGNTVLLQKQSNERFNSTSNCDIRSQRSSNIDATTSFTSSRCHTAANADELNKNCIQIDPDKVEDCLLELDAYLEEIDRDYVLACAAHGPTSSSTTSSSSSSIASTMAVHNATASPNHNNAKSTQINAILMNERSKKTAKNHIDRLLNMDHFLGVDCIGGPSVQNDHLIDDYISDTRVIGAPNLRKQISNSDIQMNQCGKSVEATEVYGSRTIDNKRKSNDVAYDQQPLKRGHKLRNTVAGSGHNNRLIASSNGAPSQCGKINSILRHFRLNSLRKRIDFLN